VNSSLGQAVNLIEFDNRMVVARKSAPQPYTLNPPSITLALSHTHTERERERELDNRIMIARMYNPEP